MNPKLQKIVRDIERTNKKITELRTLLPELEKQKTELENAEVIKTFRSADVTPDDFSDFIAAYRAQMTSGEPAAVPAAPQVVRYPGLSSQQNILEATDDE